MNGQVTKAPVQLGDPATADGREPLRICLVLDAQLVAYLDAIATESQGQLNRSSAARGLISAFMKRGVRFTGGRTEGDLCEMVGRALDRYLWRASAVVRPNLVSPPAKPAADSDNGFLEAVARARTASPRASLAGQVSPGNPGKSDSCRDLDEYLQSHSNTPGAQPVNPNLPQSVKGRLR